MSVTEWLGVVAVIVMVSAYALEKRGPIFVAVFAAGCVTAAIYACLIGSYPFLIAETVWALIAARRWLEVRRRG